MRDRVGVTAMIVVGIFGVIAILVAFKLIGQNWSQIGEVGFAGISSEHWFGTNKNGQDIFSRAIQGIQEAVKQSVLRRGIHDLHKKMTIR